MAEYNKRMRIIQDQLDGTNKLKQIRAGRTDSINLAFTKHPIVTEVVDDNGTEKLVLNVKPSVHGSLGVIKVPDISENELFYMDGDTLKLNIANGSFIKENIKNILEKKADLVEGNLVTNDRIVFEDGKYLQIKDDGSIIYINNNIVSRIITNENVDELSNNYDAVRLNRKPSTYYRCENNCSYTCSSTCMRGCKGTCTGFCASTCDNSCKDGCTSCSGCTSCTGNCSGSCTSCTGCVGTCTGNCSACGGCDATCSGCGSNCSNGCGNNCGVTCSADCINECKGCTGSCSTLCSTTCGGECKGCGKTCSNCCDNNCTANCGTTCINNCVGTCNNTCYQNVSSGDGSPLFNM